MDKIGEPARKGGSLRPARVAPRLRLGHPVEEAERVRHPQQTVPVLPGVFLDLAADVATDLDTPLRPENREQTPTDEVDQLVKRAGLAGDHVHHSPKTPDTHKTFRVLGSSPMFRLTPQNSEIIDEIPIA